MPQSAGDAARIEKAIAAMKGQLGKPYVWGAEGPNSFDCSGLMVWGWKQAGVSLPRTSQQQARYGTAVKLADVQPGDLITSDWGQGPSSHVGMYLGDGKIIHAPRPGSVVKIQALDANYRQHVNTVRRIRSGGSLIDSATDTLGGGILAPLRGIAEAAGGIADGIGQVGAVAQMLTKLALPSTWVRIMCGVVGAGLLALGIAMLAREAHDGGGPA